ncbi:superoxide dismutase [Prescottella sp. R16]|uniref:superoxide dismutase n=1 Tax=Prescottella sp. R16 TaxID=3064529 RepID=UPI00272E56CA|nr:superoxide dismutase [Prescottella sp. R16]
MADYVLPDLAYDYGALAPAISGEIMALHHGAHHAAYVAGANRAVEQLRDARERRDVTALAGLQRALAFNLSGHALHSIFWTNLSPDGGDRPDGELGAAIDEHFGSFDALRAELTAATGTVQGSGWGVLAWDPVGDRLVVHQVHDHHANFAVTGTPLLVFDAWEHAFYLQYRNVKADYIEQLWSIVDWADVGRRFDAARSGAPIGLVEDR